MSLQATDWIWMNGSFVPWKDANVHVLTHSLHYGGGTFEGIRVYKTDRGPAVFRLREHMERLHYSAGVLEMKLAHSVDTLCEATCELLRRCKLEQGYIRPLAYYGYGVMGLNPRDSKTEAMIACWPWGTYLPNETVDAKVSKYIRIHPRSTVADAKITGHYVNSILACLELKGTKYQEAIFLDLDGNVAEGPGENLFMVKDGVVFTTPLGTILPGITRSTVMELAAESGITISEKTFNVADVQSADEAFFTGTAAEVHGIRSVDDVVIGNGSLGPVTTKLKGLYLDAVYGRSPKHQNYLTLV